MTIFPPVHLVHPVGRVITPGWARTLSYFRGHFHGHRSVGLLHCHVKTYEELAVHDVNGDRISLGPADGNHRLFAAASAPPPRPIFSVSFFAVFQIDLPVVVDPYLRSSSIKALFFLCISVSF